MIFQASVHEIQVHSTDCSGCDSDLLEDGVLSTFISHIVPAKDYSGFQFLQVRVFSASPRHDCHQLSYVSLCPGGVQSFGCSPTRQGHIGLTCDVRSLRGMASCAIWRRWPRTCCRCVMCVSVVDSRVTRLLLSPCLHPLLSFVARDRQEKSFGSMMRAVLPSVSIQPAGLSISCSFWLGGGPAESWVMHQAWMRVPRLAP